MIGTCDIMFAHAFTPPCSGFVTFLGSSTREKKLNTIGPASEPTAFPVIMGNFASCSAATLAVSSIFSVPAAREAESSY
jgi:hypothetical protein